jgi:hypothetical protein
VDIELLSLLLQQVVQLSLLRLLAQLFVLDNNRHVSYIPKPTCKGEYSSG